MKTLCRLALAVSLVSVSGCRQFDQEQWPWLGYDLKSTYNNQGERKINTRTAGRLGARWRSTEHGRVSGAAAVAEDVVYIQSSKGLFALNAQTGQEIWRNETLSGSSSPTFSEGELFVHDFASVLHAFDAETGRELWQVRTDAHPAANGFSSPAVLDAYVIVGISSIDEAVNRTESSTFRGGVVAFNRSTGQEIWRHYTVDPPFNGVAVWSSVSIDTQLGLVYGTTGNNYTGQASDTSDAIFALRLHDGRLEWSTQLTKGDVFTIARPLSEDSDFGTNPILIDTEVNGRRRKLVAAGQKSGMFYALDRRTGAIVWSRNVSPGSAFIGGIFNAGAYDGRHILVAGNRGTSAGPGSEPANGESRLGTPGTSVLAALNPADGSVAWERQLPAHVWAPITVANGVGFVPYEKQLQAFDVRDGRKLFNYKTAGTITSAPVVADGAVFFGSGLTYLAAHPDETFHALSIDGPLEEPEVPTEPDGGAVVTFSQVYGQVFTGNGCRSAFCHGGNAGNLRLDNPAVAYANLVGVPASGDACAATGMLRVDPGNPDGSLLLNKMAHATPVCGEVMPPRGGVTVSDPQLQQVRAWIARGAPND
ncbi:MAG TPA: PQQ-binding-like beta-propeller repeat protein [Polyangiaceae bacterium]